MNNKILTISNMDNLILGDILFIKYFLEKYGTIIVFRNTIDKYGRKIFLIEYLEKNAIKIMISDGLVNLLKKYPGLHVGYF